MYSITIQPRFGDVDRLGHINNTVLALWFETARNPLIKIFVPDLIFTLENFPLIMAHSEYDFVNELLFQYEVEIRSWISRIGNKSFTVYHEAWQQERLCVKGSVVVVHYDFISRQSTPLPEDKKKLLEEHLL
jgi:acyl-CoA thioester hydrolase